jgi:DNA invertase Pin-like site-specific DNA recombinase|tara:strand:+ start:28170 stop:28412 length:243 start_codon:yes stop_codon:yes gene_type:complete
MGLSPKFSKQKIAKVKKMKADGKPYKYIASQTGLTVNQVTYILLKKDKQKPQQKVYAEVKEAVQEADGILKRVKKLLLGS